MRILYHSVLDDYDLEASSEAPNFPVENLQDIRLSSPWRSTDVSEEWVLLDAGSGNTLNPTAFALAGHNLTSGAVVRLQGNATDVWTSPTVDELVTWREDILLHFFTGSALRFWRVRIADAHTSDGYLQIGRIHLGTFLQMPGVAPDFDLPRRTTTERQFSITNQIYADRGVSYLAPGFLFDRITEARHQAIETMWTEVENAVPVFLVVWVNSLDVQGPIYCVIDQDELGWRKSAYGPVEWELSIRFREVF